jgi:hypothetical protein
MFLSPDEIAHLTGIRRGHAKQCAQLDKMHVPYRVNARGEPIVVRNYLLGQQVEVSQVWKSNMKMA